MTSISGYRNDVFISYSWADNDPRVGQEKGWVAMLADSLKVEVRKRLRRDDAYQPWDDRLLPTDARVDRDLDDQVKSSAILLVVLSESYLGSPWCEKELEAFVRSRPTRELGERPPIFLLDTGLRRRDKREWPAWSGPLQNLRGMQFWRLNNRGNPRIFGLNGPDDTDFNAFVDNVHDLSHDIAERLEALAGTSGRRATNGIVYLGEVPPTDDALRERRSSVAKYLKQSDIEVRPASAWPTEAEDVQAWLEGEMQGCDAFVQLLGAGRGQDGEDDFENLELDRALHLELPRLRWRRADRESAIDDSQRQRLDAAVRTDSFEDFKRSILREVKRTRSRKELEHRAVLLDYSTADSQLAKDLQSFLADSRVDCAPFEMNEDLRPSELLEKLAPWVETTDGSLVLYGQGQLMWAEKNLWTIRRLLALTKRHDRLGLVYGPPEGSKEDLKVGISDLRVIDCRQGLDHQALREFLGSLGGVPS